MQSSCPPRNRDYSCGPAQSSTQTCSQIASLCSPSSRPLPRETLLLMPPWDGPQGRGQTSTQLPFSPAITRAELEQLLGPGHPHILSVTLLQDIMYRGAPTTPPPSYLHSQLWTQELRGSLLLLHLLTTSAPGEFRHLRPYCREHSLLTASRRQVHT